MNTHSLLRILTVVVLAASLHGCASLSKNECLSANWEDIGRRDGRNGYTEERLMDHTTACAKVGITPDRDAWLHGREQGLESYCEPRNGFRIGEYGGNYTTGVCRGFDEDAFVDAWRDGREIYRISSAISSADNEIREVIAALERKDVEPKQREALAYRLGELRARRDELQREYERAQYHSRYR
jgi:hypothetical protein